MSELFKLVQRLHKANAFHIKRGRRILSYSVADNSNHLLEEAVEVQAEVLAHPDSGCTSIRGTDKALEELGDTLGVLYHLMIRLGFSLDEVEAVTMKKYSEIFE